MHNCQFDTCSFARWQHFGTLKIKTLLTHLCSHIISDSVAVEIFAIGQPCAKMFRKVRCATFFETRCTMLLCCCYLLLIWDGLCAGCSCSIWPSWTLSTTCFYTLNHDRRYEFISWTTSRSNHQHSLHRQTLLLISSHAASPPSGTVFPHLYALLASFTGFRSQLKTFIFARYL